MGAGEASEGKVAETPWSGKSSRREVASVSSDGQTEVAQAERTGKGALSLDQKALRESPKVCRSRAQVRHCLQVSGT